MKLDSTKVAVIAVVVTVSGWIVIDRLNAARDLEIDRLNAARDLENERREQRTRYLVDAFRSMAAVVHRDKLCKEELHRVEDAIMTIQLFGTKEQIEAVSMVRPDGGSSDWTPVLKELRNDLREELDMPLLVERGFTFWRWDVDC